MNMDREMIRIKQSEFEIKKIDKNSECYPYRLKCCDDHPEILYCIGNEMCLNNMSVAVVGSRKHTVYGKYVSQMIGKRLSEAGVSVVSGLAKGIDGFAHEGALECRSLPIAVLGSGHRMMYPPANLGLMEQVAINGAVISEYEPDMKAQKWSFPRRNRIISGISEAVVLIEANANSGALITAQYAASQGRTVYAVPGNINSHFSAGTNQLIRDGAVPLIAIEDLMNDIGVEKPAITESYCKMSDEEKTVTGVLQKFGGMSVDEISHKINIRTSQTSGILTILEIKGVVFSTGGKFYLAN